MTWDEGMAQLRRTAKDRAVEAWDERWEFRDVLGLLGVLVLVAVGGAVGAVLGALIGLALNPRDQMGFSFGGTVGALVGSSWER
jgi:hypothetical protein